jgi:hypothetical protein
MAIFAFAFTLLHSFDSILLDSRLNELLIRISIGIRYVRAQFVETSFQKKIHGIGQGICARSGTKDLYSANSFA